jgi:uncharacterized membrane protein YdjX (TVP38/TMEM64 family)
MKLPLLNLNLKTMRAFLIITGVLAGSWYYRAPLLDGLRLFGDRDALVAYLQGFGVLGPIVLFLLVLIQLFVAFIPGHLLIAASGYIYGAPLTIAVISASSILGSQLAFLLSRRYGRSFIYKFAPQGLIEKWNKIAGDRGPLFYFFMFVLPFVPSDMMCYVAGLGKIPRRAFLAANIAGRLWTITEMSMIGSYGFHPPFLFWVLLAASLMGLYFAWLIYNKFFPPQNAQE